MKRQTMGSAPDYTTAALVSGGANLFFLLVAHWLTLGWPAVLVLTLLLNHLIHRLEHRRR